MKEYHNTHIPTPHIEAASKDAFGKTVLMPGDPLRAKFVADHFLTDPVLVNNIRGVQGYTGYWKGVKVSVMGSGMGMPAIGIYSWELYNYYDVQNIIRIGTAGAIADELKIGDIFAAIATCTDSNYTAAFVPAGSTYAPMADFMLLQNAIFAAADEGIDLKVGQILSSDHFYFPNESTDLDTWRRLGVMATEMEAASLYINAAYAGKRALTICSVSDHLFRPGENMTADARRTAFAPMIRIALDTAARAEKCGI